MLQKQELQRWDISVEEFAEETTVGRLKIEKQHLKQLVTAIMPLSLTSLHASMAALSSSLMRKVKNYSKPEIDMKQSNRAAQMEANRVGAYRLKVSPMRRLSDV
jgi:poly-beta-hydroxyalkanoate depolymerase